MAYWIFTNCFNIFCQDIKDMKDTIVLVFRLEIDTNFVIIYLSIDKIVYI